jgi:hypothetical protein
VSGGEGIAVVHGARVHVVGTGAFDIGRSPSCDLVIEHSSISRRHARIVQARAGHEILDLDSRNGVWVDGERVRGSAPVFPGVELRIGEVPLAIRSARRATGEQDTTRRDQPWSVDFGSTWDASRPDGGLPIVAGVLEALAEGDLTRAERIFARHLALPAERAARRGSLHEGVAATLADLALRLGEARASEVWLDFVVRLYSESDLVLPLALVRSVDALARRLGGIDRGALRQYTIRLAERARALTPEQRLALEHLTLLATERVSALPPRRIAR